MVTDTGRYSALNPALSLRQPTYLMVLLALILLILVGGYCAYQMEHAGHHITGMNNHVIWGLPHVFAVTLIVTASGALNAASFSSVFGAVSYKPYARLSVVLAITLLMGGLSVLVLDLGRPDRLIIAMTHYNFRSIFAWNIFLYTGFIIVGIIYLCTMMEKQFNRYILYAGSLALVWRIILTTGTGSIFGFLVGRNALDSALIAPLFIALSLVLGSAVFVLMLALIGRWQGNRSASLLSESLIKSQSKLLLWFLLAVAYFSIVHHVTNLYVAEHQSVEKYMLTGPMSGMFWIGHIGIGIVLPACLLLSGSEEKAKRNLLVASGTAIVGGLAVIYTIIIGSQSTPQRLFPGKTIVNSTFGDSGVSSYTPSVWEWGLGVGGVAVGILLCLLVLRLLPFTPDPG